MFQTIKLSFLEYNTAEQCIGFFASSAASKPDAWIEEFNDGDENRWRVTEDPMKAKPLLNRGSTRLQRAKLTAGTTKYRNHIAQWCDPPG